jgi:membrane protein YdbS with pleckstrin-like domain
VYEPLKSAVARLLKTPTEPPEAPAGSYASVKVFRASPRYLRYKLLALWVAIALEVAFSLAGLVAAAVAGPLALLGALALLLPVALATFAAYVAVRIDYDLRYYVLTDRSLRIREGAWTVTETTLTYANVQNLRVSQGPLQRIFGIADVLVDTAGGAGPAVGAEGATAGHHAALAGLENAAEVRDMIRAYLKARSADAGLGDPDDTRARRSEGVAAVLASPEAIAALHEVRESAAALRRAAEGAAAASG